MTYIAVVATADRSFPATIDIGLTGVVSMISSVCLSLSPDIEVDVIIGTMSPIMHSSHTASTGNICAIFE